jgi:hypothetical protein
LIQIQADQVNLEIYSPCANCKAVFLGLPGPPEFVSSCFIIKFNLFLAYKNKLNLIIKQLDTNSGGPGKPRNTALQLAQGDLLMYLY